jgi:hypothetical protein
MRKLAIILIIAGSLFSLVFCGLILLNYQLEGAVRAYNEDDFALALKKFRPLGYLGNDTSQAYLSDIYAFGNSDVRNVEKAIYWAGRFGIVPIESDVNDPVVAFELYVGKAYA